ncbi:MAG: RHS repeat domain-containing protein [Planctomycetota bacterium]
MTDLTGATPESYYYSQEGLGSVRTLSDDNGDVVNHYDYDAFGSRHSDNSKVTVEQRYGFTGREKASEAGLMYYRWRMYDSGIGRFVHRDPIFADLNQFYQNIQKRKRMFSRMISLINLSNIFSEMPQASSRYLSKAMAYEKFLFLTNDNIPVFGHTYSYAFNAPQVFDDSYGLWPTWDDITGAVNNFVDYVDPVSDVFEEAEEHRGDSGNDSDHHCYAVCLIGARWGGEWTGNLVSMLAAGAGNIAEMIEPSSDAQQDMEANNKGVACAASASSDSYAQDCYCCCFGNAP